jgi:hypothetical protein
MSRGIRLVGAVMLACSVCCGVSVSALALPEGRVYEMVSPPYKAGYGVDKLEAAAPDGESVAFASLGSFDGVLSNAFVDTYLARRGASGWSTTALQPPTGLTSVFSATLEYALAGTSRGPNLGWRNIKATEAEYLLHQTDTPSTPENWEVFGGIVLKRIDEERFAAILQGASGDLCHLVVGEAQGALLPEGHFNALYDLSRGCGGEPPRERLVAVRNKLGPTGLEFEPINRNCTELLGREGRDFNAISAGGSEVFFTTNVQPALTSCGATSPGNPEQVFVRLGGARTLEVSRPLEAGPFGGCGDGGKVGEVPGEVPCPGAPARANAYFQGADEQGTRVFFTTTQALTGEDTDNGNDLYMATIGCAAGNPGCRVAEREVTSLAQVSHGGEPAEVQGVVRLAADGSRVYFVARGVLTSEGPKNPQAQGAQPQPLKGADNLYVYDSTTGETAFVADLCSGPGSSGVMSEDLRCPGDLEAENKDDTRLWLQGGESQSTPDGRFLVFSTYARLLKSDTDNAKDVYRYDAQSGVLDRVSLGEGGHSGNGNAEDSVQEPARADATIARGTTGGSADSQYEMYTRAISEDGSRIVFETAEPLSLAATNHVANIYEWHEQEGWSEGRVSLISSGSSLSSDCCAVISPSGGDIFFVTFQGLVGQDIDGIADIYDAHECTAQAPCFPPLPAERQQCSSDACHGPLTSPAPLLVPGSVPQAPGGNFAAPKKATPKKLTPAQQLVRALKACAKKPKSRRAACRRAAQKKYAKAARSAGRSRR